MKLKKEAKLSLFPEKCVYPWQILEADGETWLIMRWCEKVATIPIVHLSSVILDNFCWELAYQEGNKKFFVGDIELKTVYQVENIGQNFCADEEACLEEMICEELLPIKWSKGLGEAEKKNQDDLTAHSSFPSLLLAGEELKCSRLNRDHANIETKLNEEQEEANKTWQIQSPWRCGVKNTTGNIKPVCLKVHLAQVGLYTLLLEVLIKLKTEPIEGQVNKQIQFPEQEYILQVKDDSPAEVWGVAVDRAFPRFAYHAKGKNFSLQYLKRLSLIYLSSREGGERFMIASGLEEKTLLFEEREYSEPLYPVSFALSREKSEVVLVGDKIGYYRERENGLLGLELPKSNVTQHTSQSSATNSNAVNADEKAIVQRVKPGGKWLKKGEGNKEKERKTVLTIKF